MKPLSLSSISKIFGLFLLSSTLQAAVSPTVVCHFNDVIFSHDFPGARLNGCEQESENHYRLTITPENTPINDSPWYAFKITSDQPRTLHITVKFIDGPARYHPKQSRDGKNWAEIPHFSSEDQIKFPVTVDSKPAWIAGQELLVPSDYQPWFDRWEKMSGAHVVTIGQSVEGRAIQAMTFPSTEPFQQLTAKPSKKTSKAEAKKAKEIPTSKVKKDTIVILGRQHPPEVTGALALFPFVDVLLSDYEAAVKFRKRFTIVVIPLINPDGVIDGNWRHNKNGVDTNRDWGEFAQPETQAVDHYLKKLVEEGHQFYLGLDFHSTGGNRFYTQEDTDPLCPQQFTKQWIESIANTIPDFDFRRSGRTSDGNPTFKQWFNETYGVPSISYEMSDNIDRALIHDVAQVAAVAMMNELLVSHCE